MKSKPCLPCASQQQGRALFPGRSLALVPFGSDDSDLPHNPGPYAAKGRHHLLPWLSGFSCSPEAETACGSSKKPLEVAVVPRTQESLPACGAGCL